MLKIISTMLVVGCFAFTASAQTTEGTSTSTTSETISKTNPEVTLKSTSTPATISSHNLKTVGDYNQMDKKLCKWLKAGKIPADFPKYESTMTDEQYQKVMKTYLMEHKEMVKEEYHNKL
jgi:hypothetical protein